MIGFLALICFLSPVQAKMFRNAYISFELPKENWECKLEQTEWVCRSIDPKASREAIIILTAKEVGPTDSFDLYRKHLSVSQPTAFKVGKEQKSQVQYPPKSVKINDHEWIDGLHFASEVPNYYTRYLATIKDSIAVLVTLSAHKDHYATYAKDFFKTVQSLRVIATKNLLSDPKLGPVRPSGESLGAGLSAVVPPDMLTSGESLDEASGASGGEMTRNLIIALALIVGAVGVYLIVKKRS